MYAGFIGPSWAIVPTPSIKSHAKWQKRARAGRKPRDEMISPLVDLESWCHSKVNLPPDLTGIDFMNTRAIGFICEWNYSLVVGQNYLNFLSKTNISIWLISYYLIKVAIYMIIMYLPLVSQYVSDQLAWRRELILYRNMRRKMGKRYRHGMHLKDRAQTCLSGGELLCYQTMKR